MFVLCHCYNLHTLNVTIMQLRLDLMKIKLGAIKRKSLCGWSLLHKEVKRSYTGLFIR